MTIDSIILILMILALIGIFGLPIKYLIEYKKMKNLK